MAEFPFPARRLVQPHGPVDVHSGNPHARGLVQVVYGRQNLPAKATEFVGASGVEAGPQGLLFGGFAGSAGNRILVDGPILPQTGNFTVIVDAVIGSFPATRQTLVSQAGSGTGGGWAVNAFHSRMSLTYGGVTDYSGSTATLTVGRMYRLAVRVQGTQARYYINGIPDSNRTVASTRQPAIITTVIGANFNGVAFQGGCSAGTRIGNVFIWQRALDDSEVNTICENPWQLLRPIQQRIWLDSDAGAGAPTHELTALARAQAAASAALTSSISLSAPSSAQAVAGAALQLHVPLSTQAVAESSATADLQLTVQMSAQGVANSSAVAVLQVEARYARAPQGGHGRYDPVRPVRAQTGGRLSRNTSTKRSSR